MSAWARRASSEDLLEQDAILVLAALLSAGDQQHREVRIFAVRLVARGRPPRRSADVRPASSRVGSVPGSAHSSPHPSCGCSGTRCRRRRRRDRLQEVAADDLAAAATPATARLRTASSTTCGRSSSTPRVFGLARRIVPSRPRCRRRRRPPSARRRSRTPRQWQPGSWP